MPSLSEALKNASIPELEVICRRITPFVAGKTPPQIMVIGIDDSTLLDILFKYGIIDNNTYPFQTTSKTYGEVKVIEVEFTNPDGTTSVKNTIYIEPPSLETLKQENGDASIDVAPNTSSGFDGITGLLDSKITEEHVKKWDERLYLGWKNGTIIPQVIKNEIDGSQKVQYLIIDPEETERARERDPDEILTVKYRIFTPDVPPVVPVILDSNALRVAELVTGASVQQQRENVTSLSPTAAAASGYNSLSSPWFAGLKTTSAINSTVGKFVYAFGGFDYWNDYREMPRTWGGINHSLKDLSETLRATINVSQAGYFALSGALNYAQGNYEEGKKDISNSLYFLYKEYVFSPTYTAINDQLGAQIAYRIPGDESYRSPGGRGRNRLEYAERKLIKEFDPDNDLLKITTGLNKDQMTDAERLLGKIHKQKRITQRISGITQAAGYLAYQIGMPLVESDVKEREQDQQKYDEQQKNKKAAEKISTQPLITLQSGNTLTYDENAVTAVDPITGQLVQFKLPLISDLKMDGSDIDWLYILNQSLPRDQRASFRSDLGTVEVQAERYSGSEKAWDYTKDLIYNAGTIIQSAVDKYTPLSVIISNIGTGLAKAPKALGPIFNLIAANPDKVWKEVEFLKKGSGLLMTAKWAGLFNVATMLLTEPVQIGDGTLTGYYTRELESLRQQLKDGISDEKERNRVIFRISEYEKALKQSQGFDDEIEENKKLHPPHKDVTLSSNTNLMGEVHVAKEDYNRMKSIVDTLAKVGKQISTGTSPIPPIPLNNINPNVNFVPNADTFQPPWKGDTILPNTTIGIETCFPEYTLVLTENGHKKISDFNIGDSVLSFNVDGIIEKDIVSDIFKHIDVEIYRYSLENDSHIDITKNHPVLVDLNKFEKIGDLNIGDFLIDVNNKKVKITKIEFLEIADVYNIEVQKNNTYIAQNIRVHNKLGQTYYNRFLKSTALDIYRISSDYEEQQREYYDWIDQQFENVLFNSNPYLFPYDYVPGTPTPRRTTTPEQDPSGTSGTGTPTEGAPNPYGGPPETTQGADPNSGFEPEDPYPDGSYNSSDYYPVPEILKSPKIEP
jgi:hypothetical protein